MYLIYFILVSLSTCQLLELNETNFDNFLLQKYDNLVTFYDPKCSFCKNFLPLFNETCNLLKSYQSNISCGQINIIKEEKLFNSYKVKEIPTIVFFSNKKPKQIYNGKRTSENLIQWALKNIYKEMIIMNNCEEINSKINSFGVFVILHLKKNDQKILKNYIEISKNFKYYQFVYTDKCLDSESKETYLVINKFRKKPLIFEKTKDKLEIIEEMHKLIANNIYEIIFKFDEKIVFDFLERNQSVMVFFTIENLEGKFVFYIFNF